MNECYKFWAIFSVATGLCNKIFLAKTFVNKNEYVNNIIDNTLTLIKSIVNFNTNKVCGDNG